MFQFKQFCITQEKAAMKVGTDGVLLGAWTPVEEHVKSILDIGTGTGLVALMLAQRCMSAKIDAVEMDDFACEDANQNFNASPWKQRLTLIHESFQSFTEKTINKYDLIVTNPPFFSNGLKNNCSRESQARHDESLSQDDLILGVIKLLDETGTFVLILPLADYEEFRFKAARNGLYENRRLLVKPTPRKPVKRVLSSWSKKMSREFISDEMVLELSRHNYSETFRGMTAGFYLDL